MSLLLRRRAMMSAMGEPDDPEDGQYVYAVAGTSSGYGSNYLDIALSIDYGQLFTSSTTLPVMDGYNTNHHNILVADRSGINNSIPIISNNFSASVLSWNTTASARSFASIHLYRNIGIYSSTFLKNQSTVPSFFNLCASYGNIFTASTSPYYFGVVSGSSRSTIWSGRLYVSGGNTVLSSGSRTYNTNASMSLSASACSLNGRYAVIGGTTQGKNTCITTNYGQSWSSIAMLGTSSYDVGVNDVAMTPDGKTTILATNYGIVYSTDTLASWNRLGAEPILSCCINEKGTKGIIITSESQYRGHPFTIKDGVLTTGSSIVSTYMYGATVKKVRCNALGNRYVALRGGKVVYSLDKGSTWSPADTDIFTGSYSTRYSVEYIEMSRKYKNTY